MEDLFKKFIYTGVGLVSATVDKFQQSVEKLVDDDKLSSEEGKKILDDLVRNTESKREEFETKLKSIIEEVMVKANFATQTQIQELQDRIEELEAKVGIVRESAPVEVEVEEEKPKSRKKAPSKKAATETAEA